MTDIFISYARSTAIQAQQVAEALRGLGYGVWLDDELPAHRAYAEVIEERLAAAKAVLVIWSAEAVKSEWVQSEADRARGAHKLVQTRIDSAGLPMPFDRIQCADLTGWSGDVRAPNWMKVAASIADLLGPAESVGKVPAPAPIETLLAVMAFDNLSGDEEMAWFSDGVSDEIRQAVSRTGGLGVIARASSTQLRGPDKAPRRVAAELNVSHVLDGSVRRAGQRVRIAAELVDCRTERALWSERYDRELSDVFALQDEIAAAVAEALKLVFAPAPATPAIDPRAYDLYLKAVELRFAANALEALDLLEQALALSPGFARARAELAAHYSRGYQARHKAIPLEVMLERARQNAETALASDPSLGAAFTALFNIQLPTAFADMEALIARATASAPNDSNVLMTTGRFLGGVGRIEEAREVFRRARELDPLFPPAAQSLATNLAGLGKGAEAMEAMDENVIRWPSLSVTTAINYAGVFGHRDRFERYVAVARRLGMENNAITAAAISFSRALLDPQPEGSARYISQLRDELAATGRIGFQSIYALYAYGEADETFALIRQASFAHLKDPLGPQAAGGYGSNILFLGGPHGRLYEDPRFVELAGKIGLADYWLTSGHWPDCAAPGVVTYDFKAAVRRLAPTVGT